MAEKLSYFLEKQIRLQSLFYNYMLIYNIIRTNNLLIEQKYKLQTIQRNNIY